MRRWPVVVGALLVQVCLGTIYAWGTFVPIFKAGKGELAMTLRPEVLGIDRSIHAGWSGAVKGLKKRVGESRGEEREAAKRAFSSYLSDTVEPGLKVADTTWGTYLAAFSGVRAKSIFSTNLAVFALVMIFSGRWQDRAGPRLVALLGVSLLGISYLAASRAATNFWWVWWWIGVVGGVGNGCAYVCPIAACLKWFPESRGTITGLAVAGFGAGAYLFIHLAGDWAGLLARGGVPLTFQTFGLIFLVAGGTGALLLSNPPAGLTAAGPARAAAVSVNDLTQGECLRTNAFWKMWASFMLSSGSGLMVISALKDFGVSEEGMSEASAEQALAMLALFNGLGRIVWGTVGQAIGPRPAAVALMLSQAAMLAVLPSAANGVFALAVCACWVGFHFGGNLSLFPLMTADRFGIRHLGGNYGLVFTAYGLGGVVGPVLAGSVWDSFHSYRWAFAACSGASVLAAALVSRVPGGKLAGPAAAPAVAE